MKKPSSITAEERQSACGRENGLKEGLHTMETFVKNNNREGDQGRARNGLGWWAFARYHARP